MPKFTDSHGQAWRIELTVGTIKRIRTTLGVNFADPLAAVDKGQPPISRLVTDIEFLVDVIAETCAGQMEERGLTGLDFAECLTGEVLKDAFHAFRESLSDFFTSLGRPEVVQAIERQTKLVRDGLAILGTQVQAVNTDEFLANLATRSERELATALQQALRTTGG